MTLATGTTVTFTVAVPLFPSLVAVIVVWPTATPVTSPAELTVRQRRVAARPGHDVLVSTFWSASLVVAVSCTVWPTGTFAVGGSSVTNATGTGLAVLSGSRGILAAEEREGDRGSS